MSFLTSRRPDTSRIWNFVDHFRQADCGIPKANARWTGVPVTNVTVPQGMGGSGQCCTTCTELSDCSAWSYDGAKSLCNLFSDQGTSEFSPGIISGTKGTFRTHAQWTSLPENFKKNGYLVAGTGKVFHTEEVFHHMRSIAQIDRVVSETWSRMPTDRACLQTRIPSLGAHRVFLCDMSTVLHQCLDVVLKDNHSARLMRL